MEKEKIINKPSPFSIFFGKSFSHIKKWKIDKVSTNNKNRVTKVEIYNYFKIDNLEKLIGYLNTKKFKYTDNKKEFPRLWNILLNQEHKHIISKGKIVNISSGQYIYYYYVNLTRILIHRGRPFFLKIYRNKSKDKDYVKLEITYSYFKKNYNIRYLDPIYTLKSINEVIKKIELKFKPIGFIEDFSGEIEFNSFIAQFMGLLPASNINHINTIFKILTT